MRKKQKKDRTKTWSGVTTPEQLAKAGQLLEEFPDVYLHTHVAENRDEVAWVQTAYLIAEVIMIPLSGTLARIVSTL